MKKLLLTSGFVLSLSLGLANPVQASNDVTLANEIAQTIIEEQIQEQINPIIQDNTVSDNTTDTTPIVETPIEEDPIPTPVAENKDDTFDYSQIDSSKTDIIYRDVHFVFDRTVPKDTTILTQKGINGMNRTYFSKNSPIRSMYTPATMGQLIVGRGELVASNAVMEIGPVIGEVIDVNNGDDITITGMNIEDYTSVYTVRHFDDDLKYQNANEHGINGVIGENSTGKWLVGTWNDQVVNDFNRGVLIDHHKIDQIFLNMLNAERREKGLSSNIKTSYLLDPGNALRAQESAQAGTIRPTGEPHVRPDGTSFQTAFGDTFWAVGENAALNHVTTNPYQITSERYIAEMFYNQWKRSPGHYNYMMSPYVKTMNLAVQLTRVEEYMKPQDRTFPYSGIVGMLNGGSVDYDQTYLEEITTIKDY